MTELRSVPLPFPEDLTNDEILNYLKVTNCFLNEIYIKLLNVTEMVEKLLNDLEDDCYINESDVLNVCFKYIFFVDMMYLQFKMGITFKGAVSYTSSNGVSWYNSLDKFMKNDGKFISQYVNVVSSFLSNTKSKDLQYTPCCYKYYSLFVEMYGSIMSKNSKGHRKGGFDAILLQIDATESNFETLMVKQKKKINAFQSKSCVFNQGNGCRSVIIDILQKLDPDTYEFNTEKNNLIHLVSSIKLKNDKKTIVYCRSDLQNSIIANIGSFNDLVDRSLTKKKRTNNNSSNNNTSSTKKSKIVDLNNVDHEQMPVTLKNAIEKKRNSSPIDVTDVKTLDVTKPLVQQDCVDLDVTKTLVQQDCVDLDVTKKIYNSPDYFSKSSSEDFFSSPLYDVQNEKLLHTSMSTISTSYSTDHETTTTNTDHETTTTNSVVAAKNNINYNINRVMANYNLYQYDMIKALHFINQDEFDQICITNSVLENEILQKQIPKRVYNCSIGKLFTDVHLSIDVAKDIINELQNVNDDDTKLWNYLKDLCKFKTVYDKLFLCIY